MSEVVAWRLCASHRAAAAFSGEGSARRGGRWNPPGIRMIYTAESRSLAAMEVLVHVDEIGRLGALAWTCIPAVFPARLLETPPRFPDDWRRYPYPGSTQTFGSEWANSRRTAVLRVPSAVVPGEFNYLLNPFHPDFRHVKIGEPEPFSFDPRLAG